MSKNVFFLRCPVVETRLIMSPQRLLDVTRYCYKVAKVVKETGLREEKIKKLVRKGVCLD